MLVNILSTSKVEGDDMNILKGYVFRMYPTKKIRMDN